jgi:hypothetical protein
VLPELREVAAEHLGFLPAPVGFVRRPPRAPPSGRRFQQSMGTACGRSGR